MEEWPYAANERSSLDYVIRLPLRVTLPLACDSGFCCQTLIVDSCTKSQLSHYVFLVNLCTCQGASIILIHAIIDTRKSVGFIILMQQYSARALEGAW